MKLDEFRKLLPRGVRWTMGAYNAPETITEVVVKESVYKPKGGMGPDEVITRGYGVNPEIAMSNTIRNLDVKAVGGIASFFKHKVPWWKRGKK